MLGLRFGDYELVDEIGRGAMGRVYRATEVTSGRQVAVKVLDPGLARDREIAGRFRHEARAAAGLTHPGIVAVYDEGQAAGTYYFAMELVSGRSLAELLFDRGRLPPVEVATLGIQAADALGYAHRSGITHRDVKPANLLVDPDGRCMVADFGVALAGDQTRLTQTGESLGSPHYMAPEVIQGEQPDGRSDLYSLGVVLFEALTGERPYRGRNFLATVQQHVAGPRAHLRDVDRTLPEELDAIVSKLMARSRDDRYQTAGELAEDLQRFADGTMPLAAPDAPHQARASEAGTYNRTTDRQPRSAVRWGLVVVFAGLIFGIGSYLARLQVPPQPSPDLEEEAAHPPEAEAPPEPAATAPLEAPTPAPAPAPTDAAPPPGALVISAGYPVTVRIAGREQALSSRSERMELAPGEYQLEVEAASVSYRGRHTIAIRSGEETLLVLPTTTSVSLAANPSRCRVRIDGWDLGFVPLTVELTIGLHRFEFEWQHLGVRRSIEREVAEDTSRIFASADA